MPPTKRPIVTAVTANGIKRKRTLIGPATTTGGGGGGVAIKSEGSSSSSSKNDDNGRLYEEFIDLLSNPQYKGRGIANSVLKSHFESRYPDLVPIINDLTRSSRLTMSKLTSTTGAGAGAGPGGGETEVYFSLLSVEEATKLSGLDAPSKMVYQVIESSGNKGIWTVDVRVQTNIQQATLTKIFKVRIRGGGGGDGTGSFLLFVMYIIHVKLSNLRPRHL
jgi:hypothetical protein